MKKLILTAAIFLGSLSTFAQASPATKTEKTTQTTQTTQVVEEKYTEIKAEELPDAVKSSLKKAFPTAVLDKAFINEKKEYKLQVTVGEKVGALYADAAGKWITKQS
jgi:predicted KAP-like P-loop ATPase